MRVWEFFSSLLSTLGSKNSSAMNCCFGIALLVGTRPVALRCMCVSYFAIHLYYYTILQNATSSFSSTLIFSLREYPGSAHVSRPLCAAVILNPCGAPLFLQSRRNRYLDWKISYRNNRIPFGLSPRSLGEPGLKKKKKIVIIVKGNYTATQQKRREIHLKYLSIVDRLLRGIGEPQGVLFCSFHKR